MNGSGVGLQSPSCLPRASFQTLPKAMYQPQPRRKPGDGRDDDSEIVDHDVHVSTPKRPPSVSLAISP